MGAVLVLAACTPLVPSAISPSPSAIARRTTVPSTLAPRATPLATPRATPLARPSAAVSAPSGSGSPKRGLAAVTPRPTIAPVILNDGCSEWPAEVVPVVTQLALPPSLCLLRTDATSGGRLACVVVGCVPIPSDCVSFGSCLQVMDGTLPHYVLVWIKPPGSIPAPAGEPATLTRYLCQLHQERTLIDLGRPASIGWTATIEGREFAAAFATFETAYPLDAARWKPRTSDADNYADVCAAWYFPPARDQRIDAYLPLYQFAQKWLPQ